MIGSSGVDKSLSVRGQRQRSIGLETSEQRRGNFLSVCTAGVHENLVEGDRLVQQAKIVDGMSFGSPARRRDLRVFRKNLPLIYSVRPNSPDCVASLVIATDKHQQAGRRRPIDVPYRPGNSLKRNGSLLLSKLVPKPDLPDKVARNGDGRAIRRPAGDKLTAGNHAWRSAQLRHDVHAIFS